MESSERDFGPACRRDAGRRSPSAQRPRREKRAEVAQRIVLFGCAAAGPTDGLSRQAACGGAAPSNASVVRLFVPPATTRAGTARRAIPTIVLGCPRWVQRGSRFKCECRWVVRSARCYAGGDGAARHPYPRAKQMPAAALATSGIRKGEKFAGVVAARPLSLATASSRGDRAD